MFLMSHIEAKSADQMMWPSTYAFGATYAAKNNIKMLTLINKLY
jgi:hypothetical protein